MHRSAAMQSVVNKIIFETKSLASLLFGYRKPHNNEYPSMVYIYINKSSKQKADSNDSAQMTMQN